VAHFYILHGKMRYSDSKLNPKLVYVSKGSGPGTLAAPQHQQTLQFWFVPAGGL